MNRYEFTIVLNGYGNTPDEAWNDAVDGFSQDPGQYDESQTVITDKDIDW